MSARGVLSVTEDGRRPDAGVKKDKLASARLEISHVKRSREPRESAFGAKPRVPGDRTPVGRSVPAKSSSGSPTPELWAEVRHASDVLLGANDIHAGDHGYLDHKE